MARVKGGTSAAKSRKNTLKQVKGYKHARSKKKRAAYEAIVHAGKYSFAHRRDKKNDFRKLWNVRINAGLDHVGDGSLSYSRFIGALAKKKILVNRKMLSTLAADHPKTFERVVNKTQ